MYSTSLIDSTLTEFESRRRHTDAFESVLVFRYCFRMKASRGLMWDLIDAEQNTDSFYIST